MLEKYLFYSTKIGYKNKLRLNKFFLKMYFILLKVTYYKF